MTRTIGVDVSLGRGQDVALLDGLRVRQTWSRVGFADLTALLRELRPDGAGIDAPPKKGLELLATEEERDRLPVPPRPGTHLRRRIAEYELSRRGIGSHQTPADDAHLFTWMTAGFEVFDAARAAGYEAFLGHDGDGDDERDGHGARGRAFEVFPYASYVALGGCLSPGRKDRLAWRRSVLESSGVEGIPAGASIDVVDAVCAALTAARFVEGAGSWVGDPREGVIVLPVPALEDRYRRCASTGPTAARPCECGCGAPVRRRFLPGHDGILRARLRKAVREGREAEAELDRRGWRR